MTVGALHPPKPASSNCDHMTKLTRSRAYCTVIVSVVLCERAPDCAVTTTDAVPRLLGGLLLYPPQPSKAKDKEMATNNAAAANTRLSAEGKFLPRQNRKMSIIRPAKEDVQAVQRKGSKPKRATLADVVTVRVVLDGAPAGVKVDGLNEQAIPADGEHENATFPAKPAEGVTVSTN